MDDVVLLLLLLVLLSLVICMGVLIIWGGVKVVIFIIDKVRLWLSPSLIEVPTCNNSHLKYLRENCPIIFTDETVVVTERTDGEACKNAIKRKVEHERVLKEYADAVNRYNDIRTKLKDERDRVFGEMSRLEKAHPELILEFNKLFKLYIEKEKE